MGYGENALAAAAVRVKGDACAASVATASAASAAPALDASTELGRCQSLVCGSQAGAGVNGAEGEVVEAEVVVEVEVEVEAAPKEPEAYGEKHAKNRRRASAGFCAAARRA